jgi:hypothetical protein
MSESIFVTRVQPGQRISLGGINEIRVEFAKHIDGGQMILVGDVFRVGRAGSFLPGFELINILDASGAATRVEVLGPC